VVSSASRTDTTPDTLGNEDRDETGYRVGRLGLVVAGTIGALQFLSFVVGETGEWLPTPATQRGGSAQLAVLLLSLTAYAVSTSQSLRQRSLVWGSAYQLLGAACMAVSQYWGAHDVSADSGNPAFLAMWIVLFPLVVPGLRAHNGWVAVGSASLPVGVHLAWCHWADHPTPNGQVLWDTFFPYAISAALAIGVSKLTSSPRSQSTVAGQEPRMLGSYRLVRLLGEGGMGEVWEAEHSLLDMRAAVKVIRSDSDDGDSEDPDQRVRLARFEREARSTARLESPHTIRVHDFGVTEEGEFYFAMELLRGLDLDELVKRFGPLPASRTIEILLQVCESLGEAHAQGLVHRDVKPGNLYLCEHGAVYDFVKVLDFGLVKAEPKVGTTRVTKKGTVLGTAAFMSPEQGAGREVDARSDLYSLGCVAYWLLTARPVFDGTAIDVLVGHASQSPPPLSVHCKGEIPADLERVLLRCLAKQPEDRPRSAQILHEELSTCGAGTRWTQAQAIEWWNTHVGDGDP